jgi:lipoate-protein ligase A
MGQLWRFIPCLETCGKRQMAIDSWLLEQHRQGKHPPTLRFYTWSPVAISLGYHQRHYPPAWDNLIWQGEKLSLVRRPTGGRGVLHQGDLTYTVVTSGLSGQIYQDYQTICEFLIQGWQSLGINLDYGQGGRGYIGQANCFSLGTAADLVDSQGNKFIGSAQLRRGTAILQHGSMLLDVNAALFKEVFSVSPPSTPLFSFAVNTPTGKEKIIPTLKLAAEHCFQVKLLEQPLSPKEWTEINHLL